MRTTREKITHRQVSRTPILAPAQGGVFDFQVYITLTWKARGHQLEELKGWSRELSQLPYRAVIRMATDLTSEYAPHRAAELEATLNARLAEKPIQFQRRGINVGCYPEVSARLDDRLRRHLEPVWEKMVKMEAEHEVNQRRAQLVDDLNQRWLTILEKLPGSPVAPAAARLTDQEFADAVRQLAKDRQDTIGRLTALLETVPGRGPPTPTPLRHEAGIVLFVGLGDVEEEIESRSARSSCSLRDLDQVWVEEGGLPSPQDPRHSRVNGLTNGHH